MNSETTPLKVDPARWQPGPAREKESAARTAFEASAGRMFSDPEWGRVRARLLNFVSIVRAWQQEVTSEFEFRQAA